MSGSEPLPRPELVSEEAPSSSAYRRVYRIAGPPGACLVQRVVTRIRFLRGEDCLVEYRGRYGEYFHLADEPEERLDVHDFDLRRDRWGPSDIKRLLRAHRLEDARGEARLEVTKTFALAAGELSEPTPTLTTPGGGAFGFLATLDGEPSEAELVLRDGRCVPYGQALPFRGRPAGDGRWAAGPVWEAEERFRYRLATLSGRLETAGYLACDCL